MTDRIEAIRTRHAARLRTRAAKGDGTTQMSTLVDDDMAVLLAEVKEARDDAAHFEAEYDDAVADLVRVAALATNWERLAATAMDPEVREWLTAASSSLRVALITPPAVSP